MLPNPRKTAGGHLAMSQVPRAGTPEIGLKGAAEWASECYTQRHQDGLYRALCHNCNLTLGKFEDRPDWFLKAARYVTAKT